MGSANGQTHSAEAYQKERADKRNNDFIATRFCEEIGVWQNQTTNQPIRTLRLAYGFENSRSNNEKEPLL
jgi:hypothetical protein